MATVEVSPRVCGFQTRIVSTADEMLQAGIEIESQCTHIKGMAEQLQELSAMDELRRPINETTPYRAAAQCGAQLPVRCLQRSSGPWKWPRAWPSRPTCTSASVETSLKAPAIRALAI